MRAAHVLAVGRRVLLQIRRDPRFIGLSLLVPCAIVVLLKLVLDAWPALDRVGVDAGTNALPAGAFVVHFVAYVLAAIALVRERTGGTLDRMLVATFRRGEIVLGYVLGFATLAAIQAGLVLVTIALLYDVPRLGARLPLVLGVVFLLAIASIALGLLVSSTARSEGQIFPFIPLVIVPSLLLSGLMIPFAELAWPLQALARLVPLTYAEDVLVPVFRDGEPALDRLPYLALLAGYAAALLAVASLTLRERE
ncbi:MAG TPA: ABC transporter permease [Solirubrobacteraceae bacterium]|nr:ABC transporter permease [Solirubrobacteraceae bacterium]